MHCMTRISQQECRGILELIETYHEDIKNTIKLYRNSLFVAANHRKVR